MARLFKRSPLYRAIRLTATPPGQFIARVEGIHLFIPVDPYWTRILMTVPPHLIPLLFLGIKGDL